MTDRELVLELCKRLGLTETKSDAWVGDHQYIDRGDSIFVGSGESCAAEYIAFDFDEDGKLTGHEITG